MKHPPRLTHRRGFTIVELVIVIAVIGILATVLVPTFGDVINNAKDSAAKQEAKNAYTEYMVEAAASGNVANYCVYEADANRFVAIANGSVVGVYETKEAALAAMVSNPTEELVPTDNNKLFVYGGEVTVPDNDTPDAAPFMHISFDDVEQCFKNLKNNTYSSLYDEPFFGWLKGLHDTYGAKFSLYVYANSIKDVPNTYAAEFATASDWLKIGLHADSSSNYYASSTYEQGKAAWNNFVTNVKRITGGTDNIDRVPRLHMFAGTEAALKGMRDAECGALGFISADDSRVSYYFNQQITDYLYNNDHITDHKNGLVFLATDLRGDWFAGGNASGNPYKAPEKSTVYETLAYRYSAAEYADSMQSIIFFAHEWKVYTGSSLNTYKAWFEDACKFASDQQIAFNYPQNVTLSATDYDIYPSAKEETTRGNETVIIVDDFSEIEYVLGSFSGTDVTGISDATNRAISRYYVLKVNGGETLKLIQGLENVTLQFAIKEFTGIPLTQDKVTPGGQSYGTWLSDPQLTLKVDTRYIIIGFKNTSGNFTADQLKKLPSCLAFSTFETWTGWTNWTQPSNTGFRVDIDLKKGDIVNFSDNSVWDLYKFAIRPSTSNTWIPGGNGNWQNRAYTVTSDGKYTVYVRFKDEHLPVDSDREDIAAKTGCWH